MVTCGVDGSLYTKHPYFANNLRSVTNGLLPDGLVLKYVRCLPLLECYCLYVVCVLELLCVCGVMYFEGVLVCYGL